MFADSVGLVKYVQIRWLVQTLPMRPCAKKPTANEVLISGRSAMALGQLVLI